MSSIVYSKKKKKRLLQKWSEKKPFSYHKTWVAQTTNVQILIFTSSWEILTIIYFLNRGEVEYKGKVKS